MRMDEPAPQRPNDIDALIKEAVVRSPFSPGARGHRQRRSRRFAGLGFKRQGRARRGDERAIAHQPKGLRRRNRRTFGNDVPLAVRCDNQRKRVAARFGTMMPRSQQAHTFRFNEFRGRRVGRQNFASR